MMDILKNTSSLFVVLFGVCSILFSQEIGYPIVRNYSPKEYDNTSQVWGAIQDDNGVMYFGMTNGGGIAEYDGNTWRVIDIPNKTTVFSFAKDSAGRIYTGAINDFGFLQNDRFGKYEFISLRHLIDNPALKFRAIWQTIIVKNDVYFMAVDAIFKYSSSPESSIITYLPGKGSTFLGIFSHGGSVYVHQRNHGIVRIDGDRVRLVSDFYKDKLIRKGLSLSADSILLPTRSSGIYIFRPSTGQSIPFVSGESPVLSGVNIYASALVSGNSLAASITDIGVLILDSTGKVIQQWNERNGLTTNTIYSIFPSANDIVWFVTENGIARTEGSSAWSLWDKRNGLHGIVTDIVRFQGRLYVSTFNGIYFLDASMRMNPVEGIPKGQSWSLYEFQTENNKKILLGGAAAGIYEIRGTSSLLIRPGNYGLTMHQSRIHPNRLYIVDDPSLVALSYENGKWRDDGVIAGVRDNIRGIMEREDGTLWLGTYNAGVIHVRMDQNDIISPKGIRYYTQSDGLPSLKSVLPTAVDGDIVFTTEKGLYIHNTASDRFEAYGKVHPLLSDGTQETGIIEKMRDGSILVFPWSNKKHTPGILRHLEDGTYEWMYKPFRKLDKMEFNAVYEDSDGVLWMGTSEGLFRYDRNADAKNYDADFTAIIRKVTVKNDSIISYGGLNRTAVIPYEHNSVTFDVAAPFFDDESKTLFRYRMQGSVNEWSPWSRHSLATFTNLDEGTYTFQAAAKNLYDKESRTAEFTLTVLPPWFRTWWAYLGYGMFLLFSVGTFDRWNKRRLKNLHDKQYEEEKQRQKQLSRLIMERQEDERKRISREMHDGIGQELLVLKHNLELKLREARLDEPLKEMLQEQSAAASNIIAEVRTISHDLHPPELERLGLTETIKSILKRLRSTKQIEVIGEIDAVDGFFPKDLEINIVRIIQEAISNILKHALATTVTVLLQKTDDSVQLAISDNGKGMEQQNQQASGLGMNDITERVRMMNGTMMIESSKKNGTTLLFQFTKMETDE